MEQPSERGIRRCMTCDRKFVSPDPGRVRRCPRCTEGDSADGGGTERVYKTTQNRIDAS